jgi:hypothetical protein
MPKKYIVIVFFLVLIIMGTLRSVKKHSQKVQYSKKSTALNKLGDLISKQISPKKEKSTISEKKKNQNFANDNFKDEFNNKSKSEPNSNLNTLNSDFDSSSDFQDDYDQDLDIQWFPLNGLSGITLEQVQRVEKNNKVRIGDVLKSNNYYKKLRHELRKKEQAKKQAGLSKSAETPSASEKSNQLDIDK